MSEPFDTFNKFFVAAQADKIVLLNPPRAPLTKNDALNLAAWLVCLSMATPDEWQEAIEAVEST